MSDEGNGVLYDGTPIRARMIAWLLLGIGGLVLVPIGWASQALWLFVIAAPLLLVGLVLLLTRVRIIVEHHTGVIRVTNFLGGLKLRERQYPLRSVIGPDLHRVAGDERERPSDTWYLVLQFHTTTRTLLGRLKPCTRTYIVGRYDNRVGAMEAWRRLRRILQGQSQG